MSSGPKTVTSNEQGTQAGSTSGRWDPNAQTMPGYGMMLGNALNLGQTPTQYFPGQGYVGPSSLTQQGIEAMQGMNPMYQAGAGMMGMGAQGMGQAAGAYQNAAGQMGGINNMSLGNYGFLSNAADVANNPYVQGQLQANANQINRNLNEQMLPGLQRGAQQVNAMGNNRLGLAQGTAIEGAARQLADVNASTMNQAYGQGLGAQTSALGMTGQMLNNQLAPGNALSQAGGAYAQGGQYLGQGAGMLGQGAQSLLQGGQTVEGYQQRALQDAMARYQHQYSEPWQRMGQLGNVLQQFAPMGTQYGTSYGNTSGSNMQPNPGYKSPWQTGLGLAGMLGGAALGTFVAPGVGTMAGASLGSSLGGGVGGMM